MIHELCSGRCIVMTCITMRFDVLHLLLLFEGCCTECCLSNTAVNTCRWDGMGRTARGRLDDILSKSLNIWAVSVGHSQLWGVYEWRDKQNSPPHSVAGLCCLFHLFLPILHVCCVSQKHLFLHQYLFIIIGENDQMACRWMGHTSLWSTLKGFFFLLSWNISTVKKNT